MMTKYSRFDLDFKDGKIGEELAEMQIREIEVKHDRRWHETGNIFVETQCRLATGWQLSGLSITESNYMSYVIGPSLISKSIITFPTRVFKSTVEKFGKPMECKMEPNPTRGFLVKLPDLFDELKKG
jgi:hypothetical protein